MRLHDLIDYLDRFLAIREFPDYGPQGLQVEGRADVQRVVGMVDAGLPCIEAALEAEADLLLVHHGVFWGPARPLRGGYGRLLRHIVKSDLNLYAAHLALDAHLEVGNNAQILRRLGLKSSGTWGKAKGNDIGLIAELDSAWTLDDLVDRFRASIGEPLQVHAHGPAAIRKLGVVSGGGAPYIEQAAELGCDAYITGETSQSAYYESLNAGMHVIYGGHYQSETLGVIALGEHLAQKFGIDFQFIDRPTGI